jgi:catechol 2,3-dioxygenase-like lactoylglutathione lyase family enzyme
MNERRMRIAGIHHVTLLVADVERSLAFYRNLLGMRLVKQTVNDDDQSARHFIFGDAEGRPGTLITCLEYPDLDEGTVGLPTTEVMDRSDFKSIYLRDPDGHIVEIAAG